MLALLSRRVGSAILSLLILVTVAFVLIRITPGGPAYSILGQGAKPAQIAAVNHALGLDRPVWQQYLAFLWQIVHGRLGTSYIYDLPVGRMLLDYEGNTIALQVLAVTASLVIAFCLGLAHGTFYRGGTGRAIGGIELVLYALPTFFTGTLLILFLSMDLRIFPAGGLDDLRLAHQTVGTRLMHMALPALTITLITVPPLSRYFAQAVHEEWGRDYVRSAQARGASPARILLRHVLRNALRPLVTILGLSLPAIFAGSVVTETVFSYPGLGWLLWDSALAQDYPVVVGIVLVIGVLTVLGNLLADLANGLLDPRTSYA